MIILYYWICSIFCWIYLIIHWFIYLIQFINYLCEIWHFIIIIIIIFYVKTCKRKFQIFYVFNKSENETKLLKLKKRNMMHKFEIKSQNVHFTSNHVTDKLYLMDHDVKCICFDNAFWFLNEEGNVPSAVLDCRRMIMESIEMEALA